MFMMCLRSIALSLLLLPGGARRSIRIVDSQHGAQQQKNAQANSFEVSAEMAEALLPGGFNAGVARRADPQAGVSSEGSHFAAPRLRFGPSRAKVALQAGDSSETDQMQWTAETSRRAVLGALLGAGVGLGAKPAFAGYVTSLGIETSKPSDADVDDKLFSTRAVQASLSNLKGYKAAAASLREAFASDQKMELIPIIRKKFDLSNVRDDLNVVTTVFDDITQETLDRISRSIIYDLTELESAARIKKGETERTPKKIAFVNKWFDKLDVDFVNFLTYFGKAKLITTTTTTPPTTTPTEPPRETEPAM